MTLSGPSGGLNDRDYERFRDLIRARSGLEFPPNRRADLERAIEQGANDAGVADSEAFFKRLSDPVAGRGAFNDWAPALSINETHFFRNRPQMEALERQILPDLIKRKSSARRLRIWSAACSSGEEPYSLAMMLDQLLPDRARWNISIVGTDLDHQVLAKARQGLYGAWSFREVPPHVKATYFTPRGHHFEVAPHIREMVTFRQQNLIDDPIPSPAIGLDQVDLVVCRNVLIYFNEQTIKRLVGQIHDTLVPDGWLVVGHAEPSMEIFHQFEVRNFPGTVVYKRGSGKPAAAPVVTARPAARVPAVSPGPAARPAPAAPARATFGSRPGTPAAPPRPVMGGLRIGAPAQGRPAAAAAAAAPADGGTEEGARLVASGRTEQAVGVLEAAAAADPRDARAPYLLAKIFAGRDLPRAEEWVDISLQRSSLLAPAHYLRGLILQEKGDMTGALEAHRRCTFADPDYPLGHFALADLFARTGQGGRARKALDNVARLLDGRDGEQDIPDGDGLTVGRLRDLVSVQREFAT